MTNDEFEKLALIAADDYDIKITSESPLDGYTDEMSFIAGATWAREQCQAEIEHKDKVFSETICRELELKAEVERLTNILGKDRMDDWKRIQDAERECERLKGELEHASNTALAVSKHNLRLNDEIERLDTNYRHACLEREQLNELCGDLRAEMGRLNTIIAQCSYDPDATYKEIERLKGELAKWPNNALQRTLNRTSEELQSEKAKSLKYREAFRQHLDVMDSINSHLGYPFSQPLINAQKKLKALEGK